MTKPGPKKKPAAGPPLAKDDGEGLTPGEVSSLPSVVNEGVVEQGGLLKELRYKPYGNERPSQASVDLLDDVEGSDEERKVMEGLINATQSTLISLPSQTEAEPARPKRHEDADPSQAKQDRQAAQAAGGRPKGANPAETRAAGQPKGAETQSKGAGKQPKVAETQPQGTETQPKGAETQSKVAETQPQGKETQSKGAKPQSKVAGKQPKVAETQPQGTETQAKGAEKQPKVAETQPKGAEGQPKAKAGAPSAQPPPPPEKRERKKKAPSPQVVAASPPQAPYHLTRVGRSAPLEQHSELLETLKRFGIRPDTVRSEVERCCVTSSGHPAYLLAANDAQPALPPGAVTLTDASVMQGSAAPSPLQPAGPKQSSAVFDVVLTTKATKAKATTSDEPAAWLPGDPTTLAEFFTALGDRAAVEVARCEEELDKQWKDRYNLVLQYALEKTKDQDDALYCVVPQLTELKHTSPNEKCDDLATAALAAVLKSFAGVEQTSQDAPSIAAQLITNRKANDVRQPADFARALSQKKPRDPPADPAAPRPLDVVSGKPAGLVFGQLPAADETRERAIKAKVRDAAAREQAALERDELRSEVALNRPAAAPQKKTVRFGALEQPDVAWVFDSSEEDEEGGTDDDDDDDDDNHRETRTWRSGNPAGALLSLARAAVDMGGRGEEEEEDDRLLITRALAVPSPVASVRASHASVRKAGSASLSRYEEIELDLPAATPNPPPRSGKPPRPAPRAWMTARIDQQEQALVADPAPAASTSTTTTAPKARATPQRGGLRAAAKPPLARGSSVVGGADDEESSASASADAGGGGTLQSRLRDVASRSLSKKIEEGNSELVKLARRAQAIAQKHSGTPARGAGAAERDTGTAKERPRAGKKPTTPRKAEAQQQPEPVGSSEKKRSVRGRTSWEDVENVLRRTSDAGSKRGDSEAGDEESEDVVDPVEKMKGMHKKLQADGGKQALLWARMAREMLFDQSFDEVDDDDDDSSADLHALPTKKPAARQTPPPKGQHPAAAPVNARTVLDAISLSSDSEAAGPTTPQQQKKPAAKPKAKSARGKRSAAPAAPDSSSVEGESSAPGDDAADRILQRVQKKVGKAAAKPAKPARKPAKRRRKASVSSSDSDARPGPAGKKAAKPAPKKAAQEPLALSPELLAPAAAAVVDDLRETQEVPARAKIGGKKTKRDVFEFVPSSDDNSSLKPAAKKPRKAVPKKGRIK
ncbi:hypothetical protein DIPPA_04046 [Diplonema papillatum]|nr:hypothetical protein DIPPA_04046 [Diplonema papillatum]